MKQPVDDRDALLLFVSQWAQTTEQSLPFAARCQIESYRRAMPEIQFEERMARALTARSFLRLTVPIRADSLDASMVKTQLATASRSHCCHIVELLDLVLQVYPANKPVGCSSESFPLLIHRLLYVAEHRSDLDNGFCRPAM